MMNVYQVILKGVFQVEFDKTMKFNIEELPKEEVRTVLLNVYNTLEERGYSPINQIVGYLLSEIQPIFLDIMMHVIKFAD